MKKIFALVATLGAGALGLTGCYDESDARIIIDAAPPKPADAAAPDGGNKDGASTSPDEGVGGPGVDAAAGDKNVDAGAADGATADAAAVDSASADGSNAAADAPASDASGDAANPTDAAAGDAATDTSPASDGGDAMMAGG